jgi:hypothetical protein
MPDDSETKVKNAISSSFGDWVFKVLAASVVPLVLWGVRLESQQATQDLRIHHLESQVAEMKPHTGALIRLEEQVKSMNGTLTEIKGILNKPYVP